MNNSVALPVFEYRIETECGRIFSWSATSPESAAYEIKRDKYLTAMIVTPYTEYEAEQSTREAQEEYNYELQISTGYYKFLPKGA